MSTSSVYFSSPTNSTFFTTCCKVAIGTEERCPKCGAVVEGNSRRERWAIASNHTRRTQP